MPPGEPSRRSARALVRPTRIRLCSVALALLGALILATSANASELAVEDPTGIRAVVGSGQEPTETSTPTLAAPEAETQVTAPSSEGTILQAPEVPTVEAELPTAEVPQPAPEAPAPEAPAPEAPAPEAPAPEAPAPEAPAPEAPAPEAPEAPAPSPPAEPAPAEAPVVPAPEVRPPEAHVEGPAVEAIVETSAEPASEKTVAEHPQDAASSASQSEGAPLARGAEASSTKGTQAAGGVGAAPPGPPGTGLALGAIDPVVPARAASATIAARKSAAFGAGPVDCSRSLEAGSREPCSSWVVAPQLSESSVLPLGAPGGPLPPDPNGGGTAGAGHSVVSAPSGNSTPGPQPGGSSGGASAGGGGGGLALSGFLTLGGLLLLAAPRAMRRLRLLCRPWRGACFALIPERPG
jgi:hypothetical protein